MANFIFFGVVAGLVLMLLALSMLVGIRGHARDIAKHTGEMAEDLKATRKGEK